MNIYYLEPFFFLFFASLAISFSFLVIFSKNPIHSVLFLVSVFFSSSGLLLLIGIEFLAFLYLIVYVGAVAVLFLFVIMMLNIKISRSVNIFFNHLFVGFFLGLAFLCEILTVVNSQLSFSVFFLFYPMIDYLKFCLFTDWCSSLQVPFQDIASLGSVLYTYFFLYFILSGVILFISMIGAIVLTLHKRHDVKKQFISLQLKRNFKSSIFFLR